MNPVALITGASSGIGEVFARKLAARGFDLILTARRDSGIPVAGRRQGSGDIAALHRQGQGYCHPRLEIQDRSSVIAKPSGCASLRARRQAGLEPGSDTLELVLVTINPPSPARPNWLRAPAPAGANYRNLKNLITDLKLHTVCESAACPNVGECWNHGTATFMILGNVCTRRCGFCAVQKGGPLPVDYDEPRRVAEAVATMGLRYAVVTSVNRDDRKDGGAELFALTIEAIRERVPGCKVEVLVPDFQGSHSAMQTVMNAAPEVLNHNTETVPRLYRQVRLGARYERSLDMLRYAKELSPGTPVKSGLMLGLGELQDEVLQVMSDLRAHGVDILTLGQYLRPSPKHLPIVRYVSPAEFAEYREAGKAMGFAHVEAGPLVRSSYHADDSHAAASC